MDEDNLNILEENSNNAKAKASKTVVTSNNYDEVENNSNNDFEIEGDIENNTSTNKVVILEEEVIPEEKVISNDLDQRDDYINEAVKLFPEKDRNKPYILRKINNSVKFFEHLKYTHSKIVNSEIKEHKLKGNNYTSNLDDYVNGNFSNDYLIPIVNETKPLYKVKESEDTILKSDDLDEIDDTLIIKKTNEEDIVEQIGLRTKYRKSEARINYSYNNEINELNESTEHYYNNRLDNTYEVNVGKDLDVLTTNLTLSNNKYKVSKYKHRILGPTNFNLFDNENLVNSSDISISGFLCKPQQSQNIYNPNKHHLMDVANSSYQQIDLLKNLNTVKTQYADVEIKVGDLVRIINFKTFDNLTEHLGVLGNIEEINENTYTIKPVPEPDQDPKSIETREIVKDDYTVIFNSNDGDRQCATMYDNIYRAYLFSEKNSKINKQIYSYLIKSIIPSTAEVINKIKGNYNGNNIDEIAKQLKYYNLSIDDITNDLFSSIREILHKNNSDLISESVKNEARFKTFLKKGSNKVMKNFEFISNNSLKQYEGLYGPYPYFKLDIDSVDTRLQWLKSQPDFGEFYFKNIVKKIQDKIDVNMDSIIADLQTKTDTLLNHKNRLEQDIEQEKEKLVAEKNICVENYISKEYNSIDALKRDNNREVDVDKDKMRIGFPKIVPLNSFALVHLDNDKKQIFKRIQLSTGEHMWNLEGGINIAHIIQSNKDFCDQQFKNINELETAIKGLDGCKFSDLQNSCVSKGLEKHIHDLDDLKKQIKENTEILESQKELLNFNDNLTNQLENYTKYLALINNQRKRIYEVTEQKVKDEQKAEINPKYETLYLKIDLYLEKIALLEDKQRYELLDELLKKYGRYANIRNDENEKNIYCKYGNKIICCKHNQNMIKIFKDNKNYDNLREETIKTYGIEDKGKIWCNNCGNELFLADYETSEGFKKSGARDITNEVIEEDEEKSSIENNELVETLKKHLKEDETHMKDVNSIDIYKIMTVLLNIMGIKLNTEDELKVIKDSDGLIKTHIKNKEIWKQTYSGKSKSIDKNYENYVNINTIFYTTANLFILLQISIPHYTINKTHSKCKTSLEGFPLDENEKNIRGIKYVSCVLEQLRNGDSIWKCLKKMKIDLVLLNIIKKLYNDDYIKHKYDLKRKYIRETIISQDVDVNSEWTKFNPPLEQFTVNKETFNSADLSKKPKNIIELSNYYSLKFISELDSIINKSQVENNLFSPAGYNQSCCLTQINYKYNNLLNFYKQDALLEKYVSNNFILENYTDKLHTTDICINNNGISPLKSFSKIMFPLEEDLDQETITTLFETYISNGNFKGEKHKYVDDICILTGERRDIIKQKIYRKDEYYNLLQSILINRKTESQIKNNNLNIINTLTEVIGSNSLLQSNVYLSNFIDYLTKNNTKVTINKGWSDFNIQLEVEKDELIELFNDFDKHKKNDIKELLKTFGTLSNIHKENIGLIGKEDADALLFEQKIGILYRCIYTYLNGTISKIKSNKSDEYISIPINWKIEKSYISNLTTNALNDNELVKKYINSKLTNNTELVYINLLKILKKSTNNLKNIFSEDHIYNCDNIEKFSKITNENLSSLLEFIFVIIVKEMLKYRVSHGKSSNRPLSPTFGDESIDLLESLGGGPASPKASPKAKGKGKTSAKASAKPTNVNNMSLIDEDLGEDIELGFDLFDEDFMTTSISETYNLIYDILMTIHTYTVNSDKFTQSNINENIEKKSDIEKENNLKFIEELDKESRQALKTMISLGIDSWKDLGSKTDKELFFDSPATQVDENDELIHSNEEINDINRDRALEELGENMNEQQYQEWLEEYNRNNQEDLLQAQEANFMADDDGDDAGLDDDFIAD